MICLIGLILTPVVFKNSLGEVKELSYALVMVVALMIGLVLSQIGYHGTSGVEMIAEDDLWSS
jgi:hypothetical protein